MTDPRRRIADAALEALRHARWATARPVSSSPDQPQRACPGVKGQQQRAYSKRSSRQRLKELGELGGKRM